MTKKRDRYLSEKDRYDRPKCLYGETTKVSTGCGSMYVTVNFDDKDKKSPRELFLRLGKAGGCPMATVEMCGRLVSMAWQYGVPTSAVFKQLRGIGCHKPILFGPEKCTSCIDAAMRGVSEIVGVELPHKKLGATPDRELKMCPRCYSTDIDFNTGGCPKCRACGRKICDSDYAE